LFGIVIIPVSGMLWKSSGSVSLHSIAEGMCGLAITLRCAASASQIMKMNPISATNAIIAPIEEITFHTIIASG
jgi:hypothetical protein